jgi:hypothetical protein
MINAVLNRYYQDSIVTFGFINFSDNLHLFTLEKPWRNNERNISCIPQGQYMCSPFSGDKFKNVYVIENVTKRSNILFHIGNYPNQTEGCILVGHGADNLNPEYPMIRNSTVAMNKMRKLLGNDHFKLTIK